jgi:nucleotide-binding universal stress UspA family protein
VPAGPARVVVGLDDSAPAKAALVTAVAEARRRGARVEAVLAYRLPDYWSEVYAGMTPSREETRSQAQARAEALVVDALGAQQDAVDVVLEEGPAGDALVQNAAGAELLVVGSRSRSTLPGIVLGSVALHCVIHAPCAVMVVRPVRGAAGTGPSVTTSAVVAG